MVRNIPVSPGEPANYGYYEDFARRPTNIPWIRKP